MVSSRTALRNHIMRRYPEAEVRAMSAGVLLATNIDNPYTDDRLLYKCTPYSNGFLFALQGCSTDPATFTQRKDTVPKTFANAYVYLSSLDLSPSSQSYPNTTPHDLAVMLGGELKAEGGVRGLLGNWKTIQIPLTTSLQLHNIPYISTPSNIYLLYLTSRLSQKSTSLLSKMLAFTCTCLRQVVDEEDCNLEEVRESVREWEKSFPDWRALATSITGDF